MHVTISVSPLAAHGAGFELPDKPEGMSIDDATYHTVHSYPGGVVALAARMGVSPNTLTHKVNPNNNTHHLHPRELLAMQYLSGDASVLHAMAAALGYTCTRATPDQSAGDPVEAFMHLQCSHADFMRAVADPMARMRAEPTKMVTPTEMRRADYHAAEHHSKVDDLLASLRGRMRPLPKEAV